MVTENEYIKPENAQATTAELVANEEPRPNKKRDEALKLIFDARPNLNKDIIDTSCEIETIRKNANRLPILEIQLGKFFVLKKLTVAGRKQYGEYITQLRNEHPTVDFKSDQTIRRYQLAFVRGCVLIGTLENDKTSTLWDNIPKILAVTEEQISEMLEKKTSIKGLINCGKKSTPKKDGKDSAAGGGADSTEAGKETALTEPGDTDADLQRTIEQLASQLEKRNKPLSTEQLMMLVGCLTKAQKTTPLST